MENRLQERILGLKSLNMAGVFPGCSDDCGMRTEKFG